MIDFQAPAGWDVLSTDLGNFKVVGGVLSLEDGIAITLGPALDALGFINLGESEVANLRVVTGVFGAAGNSNPLLAQGSFNVSVWPVDPASPVTSTFKLRRSFDGGTTWLDVTALASSIDLTGSFSTSFDEPEAGVLYELVCTQFSGGAANYRLSRA